jgi:hypothetical protein
MINRDKKERAATDPFQSWDLWRVLAGMTSGKQIWE